MQTVADDRLKTTGDPGRADRKNPKTSVGSSIVSSMIGISTHCTGSIEVNMKVPDTGV